MKKWVSKYIRNAVYIGILSIVTLGLIVSMTGCGGDNDTKTGSLALSLTDAPLLLNEYDGVYVTIVEVQVHKSNGGSETEEVDDNAWEIVANPNQSYDLLQLTNCNWADLGITELEVGHYTQLRLILGDENYVVDSGEETDLTVPSGYETGIKLIKGFDIENDKITELLLDIDSSASIVPTGDGELLLHPTIKILDVGNTAVITGTVEDAGGNGVYDATVTATDSDAETFSTLTDEYGDYCLTLEAGIYDFTATDGTLTETITDIEIMDGNTYTENITLS